MQGREMRILNRDARVTWPRAGGGGSSLLNLRTMFGEALTHIHQLGGNLLVAIR